MQLIGLVDHILEDLESERWRFTNSRQMLVYGDGGIGKSHLLADATAYQIERSRPALLLLGSKFVDGNPWRQISR
jgi:ABC-type molybdenum transport system ATPase subunit/photorepair protein PhrA